MHWHAATGFSGYGPDSAEDYSTADDIHGIADVARSELADEIDGMLDDADGSADSGDYESAWKTRKLADSHENLRRNISSERANAPIYRDDPEAWKSTLTEIIQSTFPLALDIQDRRRLYVWECADPECDHTGSDE